MLFYRLLWKYLYHVVCRWSWGTWFIFNPWMIQDGFSMGDGLWWIFTFEIDFLVVTWPWLGPFLTFFRSSLKFSSYIGGCPPPPNCYFRQKHIPCWILYHIIALAIKNCFMLLMKTNFWPSFSYFRIITKLSQQLNFSFSIPSSIVICLNSS